MSRKCAYCNETGDMTKEHIFPGGIISRLENLITISDKSDTSFRGDLTIKDVCSTCNNGPLSKLDDEFIELFDKYMLFPIVAGDSVNIKFNYNSLARFLLKVTYNSARASNDGDQAVEALKTYIPYILGNITSLSGVILRLQIYTSAKKINTATGAFEGMIEPKLLRSAKVPYNGPQSDNFLIRLVAFNSFWFYVIVPVKPVSRLKTERFTKGLKNWSLQPGMLIYPQRNSLNIPVNLTTYIHPSILNGMYRKPAPSR